MVIKEKRGERMGRNGVSLIILAEMPAPQRAGISATYITL